MDAHTLFVAFSPISTTGNSHIDRLRPIVPRVPGFESKSIANFYAVRIYSGGLVASTTCSGKEFVEGDGEAANALARSVINSVRDRRRHPNKTDFAKPLDT